MLFVGLLGTLGAQSLVRGAPGDPNDPNALAPLVVPTGVATIQAAIDAAKPGQVIVLRPGTYTGAGNRDLDFKGKAITVQSENPLDLAVVTATIIDCNASPKAQHRGFSFQNGETASSMVAGLTIINGYHTHGGAVSVSNSSPTITNCIFHNNQATQRGGAIYNRDSSPIIFGCVFNQNTAGVPEEPNACGGAVCNAGSAPRIGTSLFVNNSARKSGGAIYGEITTKIVSNSRPSVCADWRTMKLPNGTSVKVCFKWVPGFCEVVKRCWRDPPKCYPGIPKCYTVGGKKICFPTSQVCVPGEEHCIWVEDCGSHQETQPSDAWVVNCTFVGNTSSQGAALDPAASADSMTIKNSILWNNSPKATGGAGTITITYSDVQGGSAGEGNINADPLFVSLAGGDYHLKSGSPCIDAGDPATSVDPLDTDLDGVLRLSGAKVDMGAYEFFVPVPKP